MTRSSVRSFWLLLGLVAAASMGYYVEEIWGANQREQFSDLYAPWWAAHELLLHGRNPYSPAVAHEIQSVIYGSAVSASADDPSGIGGGFAYPPYATLLLWPLVYTSFLSAQKIFVFLSVLVTLLSLALWVRVLRWRPSAVSWVTLALFVIGSFPVLQGLKLQNLSLVAAGLLAIAVALLAGDHLILGGILLAGCTFKPQFTVALVIWLLVWTCADWCRRHSLLWSFLISFGVLAAVSELLVPGWIPSFLRVVDAYRHYTYGHSLLDVWFTPRFGPFVSAGLLLGTLGLCWPHRLQPANSPRFLLATSLMLAANVVVMPTLAPHVQLLLLPGFLCLLPAVRPRGGTTPAARMARSAAWILTAWPWIAAFSLSGAAVWVPAAQLHRFWQVPLYVSPVLPMAVALGLAFVAHGASNPGNSEV